MLHDPTDTEIAEAWGIPDDAFRPRPGTSTSSWSGPDQRGLAAAVYASSEGMRTLVVERESIGGQAGSSSLIRNYLGFSRGISGSDLGQRGYQQAWVFGAHFVLMRDVYRLQPDGTRLRRRDRRRGRGQGPHRRAGNRSLLSPARHSLTRSIVGRRGLLRCECLRGTRPRRVACGRGRWRQLCRSGGAAPGALLRAGHSRWSVGPIWQPECRRT